MYTQIHTHTQQLKALLLWTGLVPGESLLSVRLNSWGGPPICLQLVPYCTRLYVVICRPTRHPIHTSYTHSLSERLLASVHIHSRFLTHTEFTIRFRAKHRETQSLLQKKKCNAVTAKNIFFLKYSIQTFLNQDTITWDGKWQEIKSLVFWKVHQN